jgi:hypothetical protein
MTDPLQYLRDLQVAAAPRAAPPRGMPTSLQPSPRGYLDPHELPTLALSILSEGRASSSQARSDRLNLQRCPLPGGAHCSLPIRYFDARCLIASFSIERSRARDALNAVGLIPAENGANVSAEFGCFEYRDTDLGPYNEVGLGIPALAPGDSEPALYVAHLPVNTAETDRIGRALWGYPKFVADIDIRGHARAFSTALRDTAGSLIAALEGGFSALNSLPPANMPTYTHHNGRLLRTRIQALTPFQSGDGAGFLLKVGSSDHPMAKTLQALGLDDAQPHSVRYAEPFQAMLFPGFPV